jgi:hypothetical protein
MKLKTDSEITKALFGITILDGDGNSPYPTPSEYWFFVKNTNDDPKNKLSLIIVDKSSGYVVNNDLKFNSIEIVDDKISIYRIRDNKRLEMVYWIKKEAESDESKWVRYRAEMSLAGLDKTVEEMEDLNKTVVDVTDNFLKIIEEFRNDFKK